jgi:PAS domain S-box-containing protein
MTHPVFQHLLDEVGLSANAPPDADQWRRFVTELDQRWSFDELQQRRYRTLFNQSQDAIAYLDMEGTIVDVNQRTLDLFGYSRREDMIGQPGYWFVRPGAPQAEAILNMQAMAEGRKIIFSEREMMRRDGTIFIIEGYAEVIQNDDGQPIGIMANMRDITHHKSFQKEIARSEALLNDLLTHIPVGVLAQDQDARITFSNQAAYELLGLTEDQFLGRTSFDPEWNIIREDGSNFPGSEHPAAQALATGQSVRDVVMGVYRPRTKDRAWILVNALPQPNNGSGIGVLVTFSDITAERQTAEQAQKLRTQQTLAERSRHLVESIGHDFRTPLSVISTSLYLLRQKVGNNINLLPQIEMLEAQAQRLIWLVEEAMLMSKLDSGLVKPGLSAHNLNSLVRNLIRQLEPTFVGKSQFVRIDLAEGLPKVNADQQYLGIAIEQLLLNANQHAPTNSSIRVSTCFQGSEIQITVEDLGPGLKPEEQERVFDRLYKVNQARTDGGSGLGLPIVREIMALHGGSVSLRSTPGKGSAFTLSLPVIPV